MDELFSTKEVARFLNINEKMVYSLVSEKGLPATKVTGKWLFPRHLVEQWIEANTINFPESASRMPALQGLLIVAGSNDLLLDRTLSLYNRLNSGHVAVFGNLGSMGGLQALRKDLCHIASSHLIQEDESEYNFEFAFKELDRTPAVLNFCRREQGILMAKGNPKNISKVADLGRPGIKIVNRSLGTGTRLLFDKELQKAGLKGEKIKGYTAEVSRHIDLGLEILSKRADAGPGIKAVAGLLDLDFIPLRWERFDLMITRNRFFDENIQRFLGLLHEKDFKDLVAGFSGYDLSLSGKMVFPPNAGDQAKF
jgi:excisionase family DNA binding protein